MLESLKRILRLNREARQLRGVRSLDCNAASLRPAGDVSVDEIFRSEELDAAWSDLAPTLQAFDIPDGTGGVNPGDRRAIFYLVRHFRARSVLEVGTHIGASTVHIAAAIHRRGDAVVDDGTCLISVDAIDVNELRPGAAITPAEMIRRMGCDHFSEFVVGHSLDYMKNCERRFDFIFLDGDHAAKTVYREIPAALGLLNPGGLILLHDYFPGGKPLWSNNVVIPGPFLATERLEAQGCPFDVLPLGRLPWPTKLNSNVTSLALLVRSA